MRLIDADALRAAVSEQVTRSAAFEQYDPEEVRYHEGRGSMARHIGDLIDAAPIAPLDAARLRAIIEQRFMDQGWPCVVETTRSTIALAVDDILADLGAKVTG